MQKPVGQLTQGTASADPPIWGLALLMVNFSSSQGDRDKHKGKTKQPFTQPWTEDSNTFLVHGCLRRASMDMDRVALGLLSAESKQTLKGSPKKP